MLTIRPHQADRLLKATGKLIGKTPLFLIRHAFNKANVRIYAKLEWLQLGSSVKARPAFHMISQAVASGELTSYRHILDATSGNTGIAYAAIGARLGIPVTIFMSETASKERSTILKALQTNIIYTSAPTTGDEAQQMALSLFKKQPNRYFHINQYGNENNWKAHYQTTAQEIYRQTRGRVTHFVAGLGTTGTLVGTGRRLQELNPAIRLIALQPDVSTHLLEGWKHLGSSTAPAIYDASLAHQTLAVSTEEAYEWIKRVAVKEGLLLSPSSAAALAGAVQVAEQIDEGIIVTVFADSADKYGEVINSLF
ncbi:cysteine synthase family protein [Rhodocytophaga rosea]|uniref:Cysteine synthase family protein n=1 Tax=Rhodocytophaga rosea TaxID=2704465 RepID=A0A6C0GU56_9BACT|nr:cysteine synthase family protein [Rhodocytophaga rosea]QHT71729.1 cysteine synthase family protein [Rhodocytophaga rosea]